MVIVVKCLKYSKHCFDTSLPSSSKRARLLRSAWRHTLLSRLSHYCSGNPVEARVQEHERLALAVLLVVGVDVAELYVVGHPSCSFSCLDLPACVAQKYDGAIERPRFDEREFDRCVELAEERGSAPSATGLTNSQYSSMRSSRMNVAARSALA